VGRNNPNSSTFGQSFTMLGMRRWGGCFLVMLLLSSFLCASAQDANEPSCGVRHLDRCITDVAKDQLGVFTSPFRAKPNDLLWIAPLSAATATSIAFDARAMHELGHDSGRERTSRRVSDIGGVYLPIAGSLGMYAFGSATHHHRLRETGILSAEALIDATIATQAVKLATNRERPNEGDGEGRFWPHGTSGYKIGTSFPSGHSAAAWSVAQVISEEYPGWLPTIGAFGIASTVSVTRVTAREHFPSDVLVGSTFGYLIGGYVYHHHSSQPSQLSGLTFSPIYSGQSKSYGLALEIDPHDLHINWKH